MRFDTIDINRLADRQRISEWLQLGYWLWLLAALIIACGCNRITNPRESKQVAIQQADAQLVYERTIDLGDSGGPALGAPTTFAVTDGAFYLVDDLHKAVFEYDIEGQYIHTIGRRGKGKGEYLSPMSIGVGQGGQVYVYDAVTAKLNTYGRDGRFIGQFSASNKMTVGKFVVDKQGDILQMIGAQDASGKRVVRLLKTAPQIRGARLQYRRGERRVGNYVYQAFWILLRPLSPACLLHAALGLRDCRSRREDRGIAPAFRLRASGL